MTAGTPAISQLSCNQIIGLRISDRADEAALQIDGPIGGDMIADGARENAALLGDTGVIAGDGTLIITTADVAELMPSCALFDFSS